MPAPSPVRGPAPSSARPLPTPHVGAQQLERDHPRMARLFNRGLLPFGVWEQLLEAEAMMDHEVHEVQAEAEKLQKGWGQGVFGQAYSMLRRERQEEKQHEQMRRDAAVLTIEFTKLSGGVVTFIADGRNVGAQTQMLLRKDCVSKELAYKTDVKAELVVGMGEEQRTYTCEIPEMTLDKDSDKAQWKQLGNDSTQLRLQIKFVRKCAPRPRVEPPGLGKQTRRPGRDDPRRRRGSPSARPAPQGRRAEDDLRDWGHPRRCAAAAAGRLRSMIGPVVCAGRRARQTAWMIRISAHRRGRAHSAVPISGVFARAVLCFSYCGTS